MYLAERIVLTKGIHKEEYELADRAAPLAKLLYNAALFHVRQIFTGWDKDVERRIVSGTDDGLFSGDPVSLATHSGRGDMNCAV